MLFTRLVLSLRRWDKEEETANRLVPSGRVFVLCTQCSASLCPVQAAAAAVSQQHTGTTTTLAEVRHQEIISRQQQLHHHDICRGYNNNNSNSSSDSSIQWHRWQDCWLNMLFESTNANIICEYDMYDVWQYCLWSVETTCFRTSVQCSNLCLRQLV